MLSYKMSIANGVNQKGKNNTKTQDIECVDIIHANGISFIRNKKTPKNISIIKTRSQYI